MSEIDNALHPVALQFGLSPATLNDAIARHNIIDSVNEMIIHNFEKLISILYRLDVSEKKINQLLQKFPATDAAAIITDLMLERENEKIASRKKFKNMPTDDADEKW